MACTAYISTEHQTDLPSELPNIPFQTPGTFDFYFALPTANTADRTVTFPDANLTAAGQDIDNNFSVTQNFQQDVIIAGTLNVTEAGLVSFEDEIIFINDQATAADPVGPAGVQIEMLGTDYFFGRDTDGLFKVGLIGSEEIVLTAGSATTTLAFPVASGTGTYNWQNAADTRTDLNVDPAGTDNSTPVTLAGTPDYITIAGQELTLTQIDLTADVQNDLPVTHGGTGVSTIPDGAIMIGAGVGVIETYDLPENYVLIGSGGTANPTGLITGGIGRDVLGDATAADVRTTIDVDQAGTDNSTPVTLAGTPNYITILGQQLTLEQIDLTADVTGDLPVAEGGTGASDAGTARTNLGFVNPVLDYTEPPIWGGTTPNSATFTTANINTKLDILGTLGYSGISTVQLDAAGDLDISSTPAVLINVEGFGVATDTMVSITGGYDGQRIELCRDTGGGYPITIQHSGSPSAGQIFCTSGADIVMNDDYHTVSLRRESAHWVAQALAPASGAGYVPIDAFAANGDILVGTGSEAYETVTAFTTDATPKLKHEYGGFETDISAITTGGIFYGSGAGAISILPQGADGRVLMLASGIPSWEPPGTPGLHDIDGASHSPATIEEFSTAMLSDGAVHDWTVDNAADLHPANMQDQIQRWTHDIIAGDISTGHVDIAPTGFMGPADSIVFINGIMYESGAGCFVEMTSVTAGYDRIVLNAGHPFQAGDRIVIWGLNYAA